MRFSIAIVWARNTFFAVMGKKAPALTVASLATIMHNLPLTFPRPVTTPAHGAPPYSAYIPCAAHSPSSRNSVSSSSRSFIRSLAVSLPLPCCASAAVVPPPSRITSSSARIAAISAKSACLLACARGDANSLVEFNSFSIFNSSAISSFVGCRSNGCWSNSDPESRPLLSLIECSRNGSAAYTESNPGHLRPLRISAQRNPVAIFQVGARLSVWQADGLRVVPLLQQAALRSRLGARDRTGGQKVAGAQVAAVAGVVRNQLCDGPIQAAFGAPVD